MVGRLISILTMYWPDRFVIKQRSKRRDAAFGSNNFAIAESSEKDNDQSERTDTGTNRGTKG